MSVLAIAAPLVALFGALLAVVGLAGARFGVLSPLAGFALFTFAGLFLCGALALGCGLVGVFRTRFAAHRGGAAQAWWGLVAGAVLLATLFLLAPPGGAPPIHDVTTDPEDAPVFLALAAVEENRRRDLDYPHGPADTPELQRRHYPTLAPAHVEATPDATLRRALEAARSLGWEIVEVRPPRPAGEESRSSNEPGFEAVDRTTFFGFTDDVVVRLRDEGARTRVDVRSTSRVGQSDLGANAARIRDFLAALEEEPRARPKR